MFSIFYDFYFCYTLSFCKNVYCSTDLWYPTSRQSFGWRDVLGKSDLHYSWSLPMLFQKWRQTLQTFDFGTSWFSHPHWPLRNPFLFDLHFLTNFSLSFWFLKKCVPVSYTLLKCHVISSRSSILICGLFGFLFKKKFSVYPQSFPQTKSCLCLTLFSKPRNHWGVFRLLTRKLYVRGILRDCLDWAKTSKSLETKKFENEEVVKGFRVGFLLIIYSN